MRLKKIIKEKEKKFKKEWANIMFNFLIILLALSVIVILKGADLLTALLLAIISLIALLKWKSTLALIIYLFFGLIFGLGELIISNYKIWIYNVDSAYNVPIWLFLLWGLTATFIYETILEIKK